MAYVRLPLSGNVWQDINPFRWIFKSVGQLSFFTVNVGQSTDPGTEEAILEVATYGKQLGRIGEALLAIVEQPNTANFTDDQKRAIEDFKTLMREIAGAKKRSVERPSS